MSVYIKTLVLMGALVLARSAEAQITLYQGEGFRGRAFTAQQRIDDLSRYGFNDAASSVTVDRGRWEVCEHANFRGRCAVLRRGSYNNLSSMGLNDRISSLRRASARGRVANERPPPMVTPDYAYRRRPNEVVNEVPVTSVRAVMENAGRRCWVERQQVVEEGRGKRNVAGGVLGALIGGVLGHQIGAGSGRDLATVGGAVAGAAIGSNQNRDRTTTAVRDVQRCDSGSREGRPAYWDVTYQFHGVTHYAQMSEPPGATILVNRDGEPRQ